MCDRISNYYETILPNGKQGLREEVQYAFCDDLWREIKSYLFQPPHIAHYISHVRENYYTHTDEKVCEIFNFEFKYQIANSGIRGTKQFYTKKIDECKKHPLWNTYVNEFKKKLYNEKCILIKRAGNSNWKPSFNGDFVDLKCCFHKVNEYYSIDDIPFSKAREIILQNGGIYPEPKLPKNIEEDSWSDFTDDTDDEYYNLIKLYPCCEKVANCILVQSYARKRLKVFKEKVDNARLLTNKSTP